MREVNLSWEEADEIEVDREEIAVETDIEQLQSIFSAAEEMSEHLKCIASGLRDVGYSDEDRLFRLGMKIAYHKMAMKWTERRLLVLGGHVPHPPTDPRKIEVAQLNKALRDARAEIAALKAA